MNDVPERIWIQSDTKNHLSELRELEVQPISDVLSAFTEYLSRTYHNALVAEAYEVAVAVCEDAKPAYDGHRDPDRAERENAACDVLSDVADEIRAMTPSDALAAREARDKRVRDEALREAAEIVLRYKDRADARADVTRGVGKHEATGRHEAQSGASETILSEILALIEGGQTDE